MVSLSEAPEDVAVTYRRQVMEETKETLLKPYKKMCERKKVFLFSFFTLSCFIRYCIAKCV